MRGENERVPPGRLKLWRLMQEHATRCPCREQILGPANAPLANIAEKGCEIVEHVVNSVLCAARDPSSRRGN